MAARPAEKESLDVDFLLRLAAIQQEIAVTNLDVQGLMDLAVERSRELARADYSTVDLSDGDYMVCTAVSGSDKHLVGTRFDSTNSLSGLCARTLEVLICDDSETDPRVDRDLCRQAKARSMVVVPLLHSETTMGVLRVFSEKPSCFTLQTAALLLLVSQMLSAAMRQTQAFAGKEAALQVLRAREREIAQLNQDLEARIHERTLEMLHNQERFQFALEGARLVAWDWDLVSWTINRFGYLGDLQRRFPAQEAMTIETMLGRISESQRPPVEAALRKALTGDGIYWIEYSATAGNDTRWLRHHGRCEFDEQHRPLRIRGVTADITAQKMADVENERVRGIASVALAREQAALHASEMKSTFLANMSHEIRTPINGVMGLASLLIESPLNEEQRSYARNIYGCANNLLAIINDILDLSKAESGKMTLEPAPFALRQLIEDVLRVLRVGAEEKGLRLTSNVATAVPDALLGDATRLRQIILNLVSNAVKFTEQGEVCIRVDVLAQADGQASLEIVVQDEGIGIAADVLPTLFAPFIQADASTTRRFGGTGLGLAICKRLVELMGGEIGATSVEGEGSVFSFRVRFPVCDQPNISAPAGRMPAFADNALRVLVAEDNQVNQLVIRKMLEKEGCSVTLADNGAIAVRALHAQSFDVVLMDCQMPEMDGFAAASAIRHSADPRVAATPIIALTANAMSGDRERCLAAGMNSYLSKPIKVQQLAAELGTHARRPGSRDA